MTRQLREIEVVALIFAIPAILLVLARIAVRRRGLWTDDALALFSLLALIVQLVAVFIYTQDKALGTIRYYMMAITFYLVIWSARLSLLFSIIRIDPHIQRRKWLYSIAALYVIAAVLLVTQLLWLCQHEPNWKSMQTPQCRLTLAVGVAQLATDILADGTLLVAPIILFRSLDDRGLRFRLSAIFSTCVITTIVSIVHTVLVLGNAGPAVAIAGVAEDCTSLIVCNIPAIATAIMRQHNRIAVRKSTIVISTISFRPRSNPDAESSVGTDSTVSNEASKLPETISISDNMIIQLLEPQACHMDFPNANVCSYPP